MSKQTRREAIVQAADLALPELDLVGDDQIPAPVLRSRDRIGAEALARPLESLLEHRAVGDRLALRARPGAELRLRWARRKVGVRLPGVERLDRAADPNLAVELAPVKDQRRARALLELPALGRVAVGEEAEAALIDALEQDHAGIGVAGGVRGGQGHRLVQGDLALGDREPGPELGDRVRAEVLASKRGHVRSARHPPILADRPAHPNPGAEIGCPHGNAGGKPHG